MLKLTQRKGSKNYFLRGTVAGVSVYESTGTSEKRAADAIRIRRQAEILERVSLGKKATATFAEAALNYMESGGETRFLTRILEHFGPATKLSQIDNQAVNEAAQKLYPGCAPSTINRQLITPISAILTMAAEDGLCEWKKLRRRKVTGKKERWLTPEEFEAFLSHVQPHLKPIIGMAVGSGARVRELVQLHVSTLHLSTRQAFLEDTKTDRPRMVRFPTRTAELIQSRDIPETGHLFLTNRGEPYKVEDNRGGQIRRSFNKSRDMTTADKSNPFTLGKDVTPHVLRHTWATWYYAQTRDFGALMDLGGWSRSDTVAIYRKIAPDDLAQRLFDHGWDFRTAGQIHLQSAPHLRVVHSA